MIEFRAILICDSCGKELEGDISHNVREIPKLKITRRKARELGWSCPNVRNRTSIDLCSECVESTKPRIDDGKGSR